MKVVLLEKYKKLGEVGDVANVKNGYARNYLIPNGKAVQATQANLANIEARKAELVAASKAKEAEATKLASKIKDKIVGVIKQAGDDGRLYGAVHTSEIAEGINQIAGTQVTRKQVILNYSIKFIGIYQIDIDLGEGVYTTVFLNVARSEGEVVENAKKFKSGELQLTTANTDLVAKAASIAAEVKKKADGESAAKPAEEIAAEPKAETAAE